LSEWALSSAREEVRHARIMGALAGVRAGVAAPARRRRSLEEIAVENVREGCVRETFGAAVAQLQARTAADARMQATMASIYPDEERHAELAFAVDTWLRTKLSPDACRRLDEARHVALSELASELTDPVSLALLGEMRSTLFSCPI
jgi:hypothetical protein